MGRIAATLSSFELNLLNRLHTANSAASLASVRLASGHAITSPSDNPAAFVSLSKLQSELGDVTASLTNVTAASSIVSQTQLALDQVRTQLNTIRTAAIADQDGTLSAADRAANQAKIDTAIVTINQIVSSTINGRRILDGSADFTYTGANNTQVAAVEASSLGYASSQTISGTVSSAATQAQLVHTEASGLITANATFTLAGPRGNVSLSVANGESLATVAQRVNAQSDLTGVSATVVGNDLQLKSVDYGSGKTIAVTVTSGTFAVTGGNGNGTAAGTDAVATINGQALTAVGNTFSTSQNGFQFSLTLQPGTSGALAPITVSGHGLAFALSTDLGRLATLAIPGLQASRLGGVSGKLTDLQTGGALAGLGSNTASAVRVVDEALDQLTRVDGRVDGFAEATISASSGLLQGMKTRLTDAVASIDAVDPVAEALTVSRNKFLAANAIAGLEILAQQRSSILQLIQRIANPNSS